MKIDKIQKILQSNDAKLKLKQLGENPANLKASKDSLVIIYDDKTYEIKMINTLTHKRKRGPGGNGGEQKPSTRDLLLSFIKEQRKFNAKQEKFNNWVVDVFNKNNLKV